MRAELTEPVATTDAALRQWLEANHAGLLTVAEALVDRREELLAAAAPAGRQDLAEAIDRAGEAMSGRPSRSLASAVSYALFLLGTDGPAGLGKDHSLRKVFAQHGRLREEFNRLREQRR
jgi:hypothetical protein